MGHELLAPSSAAQWIYCAGSALLQSQIDDTDTKANLEGEATHEMGEQLIDIITSQEPYGSNDFVGRSASNGYPIDKAMFEAAELYACFVVNEFMKVRQFNATLDIERKVDISVVHGLCGGTPDAVINALTACNFIHVIDLKYGFSQVEALKNWQLMLYAIGVLNSQTTTVHASTVVKLTIVAPRNFNKGGAIDTWETTAGEIYSFLLQAQNAATLAIQNNAPLKAGKHCRNCKAMMMCDAVRQYGLTITDFLGYHSALSMLTPAEVALELEILTDAIKVLEDRVDILETHGLTLINQGSLLPGYGIDYGKERTVWKQDVEDTLKLGEFYGIDLVKPAVKTPKQAIDAGIDPKTVRALSKEVSGKKKLSRTGDLAATVFGKLHNPEEVFKK